MGGLFRLCLFGTCGALCGDMSCLLFGWFTCSFTNELQTGLLPDDFERGGQCGTRQLRTLFFLYRCEIRNRNTRSTIFFFGHSELTLVSPTVTFPLQENAHV